MNADQQRRGQQSYYTSQMQGHHHMQNNYMSQERMDPAAQMVDEQPQNYGNGYMAQQYLSEHPQNYKPRASNARVQNVQRYVQHLGGGPVPSCQPQMQAGSRQQQLQPHRFSTNNLHSQNNMGGQVLPPGHQWHGDPKQHLSMSQSNLLEQASPTVRQGQHFMTEVRDDEEDAFIEQQFQLHQQLEPINSRQKEINRMTVVSWRRGTQSPTRQSHINSIQVLDDDQPNMGEVLQDDYEKRKLITFTNTSNKHQQLARRSTQQIFNKTTPLQQWSQQSTAQELGIRASSPVGKAAQIQQKQFARENEKIQMKRSMNKGMMKQQQHLELPPHSPAHQNMIPKQYNNYVIEEESRSFQGGSVGAMYHPPGGGAAALEYQNQFQNYNCTIYNSPNFDEMADEMFEIQVSPQRAGQRINHIQSNMMSNRGTIKKSDQKIFTNDYNSNQQQQQQKVSQFHQFQTTATKMQPQQQHHQETTPKMQQMQFKNNTDSSLQQYYDISTAIKNMSYIDKPDRMRFGQFPSSARRDQVQQMAQALRPYNTKESFAKFRNSSNNSQIKLDGESNRNYQMYSNEMSKMSVAPVPAADPSMSPRQSEIVPATVKMQKLRDNPDMQRSMNKISSTISQAKNLIINKGMNCMPEKNEDEQDIEEEKDFFDQMPSDQLRLILPNKQRSVSWKAPKVESSEQPQEENQENDNNHQSHVKPFRQFDSASRSKKNGGNYTDRSNDKNRKESMVTVTQIPTHDVFRQKSPQKNQVAATSRTSPLRTSLVAINPPNNKMDDVKRRQTLLSSAIKSGNMPGSINLAGELSPQRKAANSAVVIGGDGFYKQSNSASKIDFMKAQQQQNEDNVKPKKDMASIEEMGGTITNDSMIQQIDNLDISAESKKFLSSKFVNDNDGVNLEQYGFEQFVKGQQQLQQKHKAQQRDYQQEYDKKLKELQERIDIEMQEKDRLKAEAETEAQAKIIAMQVEFKRMMEDEMEKKMAVLDRQYKKENKELKSKIEQMQGSFQDMQSNLYKNELIRKVQQQQITHLKGNMRVFCRVKPIDFQQEEVNMFDQDFITFPQLQEDAQGNIMEVEHQTIQLNMPKHGEIVYNFDHVFLPDSSQKEVFNEIKPFVQAALDGQNTCIFAYGQTGSGKTFTMEGPPDAGELIDSAKQKVYEFSGILPRVALFIQHEIDRYKRHFQQQIFIEVSALEIYCENIRDLLYRCDDPNQQRYVEIKAVGNKQTCLGQTWVKIHSPQQFLDEIAYSSKKRVFKNNGINPHSSRSHHVFQIRINAKNKMGKPCQSYLNIVDLAGSERRSNLYNNLDAEKANFYKKQLQGSSSRKKSIFGEKKPSQMSVNRSKQQIGSPSARASIMDQQGNILIDQQNYNKYVSNNPSSLKKDNKFTKPKTSINQGKLSKITSVKALATNTKGQLEKNMKKVESLPAFTTTNAALSKKLGGMQTTTSGGITSEHKLYDVETEGKFINKNLTTLGRVFAILSNRKLQGKVIPPYRECKLTRLLQNSLQPDEHCKTLMIVNVCQNANNLQQSKESLDFASKAMVAF